MSPDVFFKFAEQWGLPVAACVALAIALWLKDKNSVPKSVYDHEVERATRQDDTLSELARGVDLLVEVLVRGGRKS